MKSIHMFCMLAVCLIISTRSKRSYSKNRNRLRQLRHQRKIGRISRVYAIGRNEAAMYLRKTRYNSGNGEELMVGNLERECVEEICSAEEVNEIFFDNRIKAHFVWKSYRIFEKME